MNEFVDYWDSSYPARMEKWVSENYDQGRRVEMHVPDEMMSRYFERRKRDLEECIHHLKKGDLNFLEKVGHQLKGNGVTFGYPELSEIGTELERAARERNRQHISEAMGKFSHWVDIHLS